MAHPWHLAIPLDRKAWLSYGGMVVVMGGGPSSGHAPRLIIILRPCPSSRPHNFRPMFNHPQCFECNESTIVRFAMSCSIELCQ
jgi:hypothetical protein